MDIMAMFEFDIAALGEGKEAELSAKNQRSEEEIERFAVDEGLADLDRAQLFLSKGLKVQRLLVLETVHTLYDPEESKSSFADVLELVQPTLLSSSAPADEAIAASVGIEKLVTLYAIPRTSGIEFAPILLQAIRKAKISEVLEHLTTAMRQLLSHGIINKSFIVESLIPTARTMGGVSETRERRVSCCRLLAGICATKQLDEEEVSNAFLKQLVSLCQDTESAVRQTMAENLEAVARSVSAIELSDDVLDELAELMRDEETAVQSKAVKTAVRLHSFLPPGLFKERLLPDLLKLMSKVIERVGIDSPSAKGGGGKEEEASSSSSRKSADPMSPSGGLNLGAIAMPMLPGARDPALDIDPVTRVLAEMYGPLIVMLSEANDVDCADSAQLEPWLKLHKFLTNHAESSMRALAATCLPALATVLKPTTFERAVVQRLLTLVEDHNDSVRVRLAKIMHGVAKALGPDAAGDLLKHAFVTLLSDHCTDVSGAVIDTMYLWLPAFACATLSRRYAVVGTMVTAVYASAAALPSEKNWRRQVRLLRGLLHLPSLYPNHSSIEHALGIVRGMIDEGSAHVRAAAVHTLVFFLRFAPTAMIRAMVGEYLEVDIRGGPTWWRRMLFVEAVGASLWLFSRQFVKAHLLTALLGLVDDPVPAVRAKALTCLPMLRLWLVFPKDAEAISQLSTTASEAQDDVARSVAIVAKHATDEIARLDMDFSGSRRDTGVRAAVKRLMPLSVKTSVDKWCCAAPFLTCPFLPPDVCIADAARYDLGSCSEADMTGFRHDGIRGSNDGVLDLHGSQSWLAAGAPSEEEEKRRVDSEEDLEAQALAEEEEESRRQLDQRRAEARARADRDRDTSATARMRNWDQKRARKGVAGSVPPRGGRAGATAAAKAPGHRRASGGSSGGRISPTARPVRRTSPAARTTSSSGRIGLPAKRTPTASTSVAATKSRADRSAGARAKRPSGVRVTGIVSAKKGSSTVGSRYRRPRPAKGK